MCAYLQYFSINCNILTHSFFCVIKHPIHPACQNLEILLVEGVDEGAVEAAGEAVVVAIGDLIVEEAPITSVFKILILHVKIIIKWYPLDNLETFHQNLGISFNLGKDLSLNIFKSQ